MDNYKGPKMRKPDNLPPPPASKGARPRGRRSAALLGGEPSGTVTLRLGSELHRLVALAASARGESINDLGKRALIREIESHR